MSRLKSEQRVSYSLARLAAWDALSEDPVPASFVAMAIWPNANFHAQGAGGAASRILHRMKDEGLAYWTVRTSLGGHKSWGWVRLGQRPELEQVTQ